MGVRSTSSVAMAAVLALALAGCGGGGGGGGGGIASTPTPPPPPPPPPAAAATIFTPAPATQEFAVVTSVPGTDMQLRYDAASGEYEVSFGSEEWQRLSAGAAADQFDYGGSGTHGGALVLDLASSNYDFSRMGNFANRDGPVGFTAFGLATLAAAVPVSGTATYNGQMFGGVDVLPPDYYHPLFTYGTVQLSFDFGAGTLAGNLHPNIVVFQGYDQPYPVVQDLGTYAFKDTVFSAGSTTFSGTLDTNLAGPNGFSGQFTGPHAEEMIGNWNLPFIWNGYGSIPGDGQVHSAWGVMIGKR